METYVYKCLHGYCNEWTPQMPCNEWKRISYGNTCIYMFTCILQRMETYVVWKHMYICDCIYCNEWKQMSCNDCIHIFIIIHMYWNLHIHIGGREDAWKELSPVCVCVYMYIFIYIYIYIFICVYTIYMCIYIFIYLNVYTHIGDREVAWKEMGAVDACCWYISNLLTKSPTHTHTHKRSHTHTHTHTHTYTHIYTHTHTPLMSAARMFCIELFTHTRAHTHTHACTHPHTRTHNTHTSKCARTHTQTHTHTHTHMYATSWHATCTSVTCCWVT